MLDHLVALKQPGYSVSLVSYCAADLRWEDSCGASCITPPSADLEALCPQDMDYSNSGIEYKHKYMNELNFARKNGIEEEGIEAPISILLILWS